MSEKELDLIQGSGIRLFIQDAVMAVPVFPKMLRLLLKQVKTRVLNQTCSMLWKGEIILKNRYCQIKSSKNLGRIFPVRLFACGAFLLNQAQMI